ncbi:Hypothetical protein PHPALM_405 [Phytophthora palmivora]|uniref:Uncharacterized protein n=1 Tax=Phytophthora palmivora TaxID=4796 RepID=A0A2P4YUX5_9STRA|nr:Hypothetical protein PHPALM_405 [Phytophthora palmivora]
MLRQMFEFFDDVSQQQQQVYFQQQMVQHQVTSQRLQKKKGNPPIFNGVPSDNLDLWLFSTEQYYADYQLDMANNTSDFVNLIFANLGPSSNHVSVNVFATLISSTSCCLRCTTFDGQVPNRWTRHDSSIYYRNQMKTYQRNLRSKTSAFVSQNIPDTLQRAIELAQRF